MRPQAPGAVGFGPADEGKNARMKIFTKRNALIGWAVMRYARRRLKQRVRAAEAGGGHRRELLAGLGLAAGATAAVLYARRGNAESAHA
jgi:hypothetical protein